MSCSYTPSQNGRVERKHRHVTKTGLALLFYSHVPPRHWVDAFSTTTYIINRLPMLILGGFSLFEFRLPYIATNLAPSTAPMDQIHATTSSAPSGSHPMITRAKSGIFKTRHPAHLSFVQSTPLIHALLATFEPKGFKSAAKNPAWLATMDDEMKALQINHTWDLVPRPSNANISYTQLLDLDYTGTFSPVVKASIVCVGLSLVVSHKWPLRQLDVKNAFFNGILHEIVYMEQPRAMLILVIPFTRAYTSLFVFNRQDDLIYLLLYVDDIILTGNNSDLGSLTYFLGLEASSIPDGLFLSQVKYATDVLARAQLLDIKPVTTPMIVSQRLFSECRSNSLSFLSGCFAIFNHYVSRSCPFTNS
ncbi:hypothetical protein AAG906_015491 [Vitis piasezkii]